MITITSQMSINNELKKVKPGDTIFIKKGVYNEKIIINIDDLTIIGDGINETIIKNNDYFHKILDDNNEANTFRTYTCLITGKNIKLSNLTIENTSLPSNKYGQAVALHACGDILLCENVCLKSAQDTLFTGPLPLDLIERYSGFLRKDQLLPNNTSQVYKNCIICGDTDFIFGCSQALFTNCDIISIGNGFVCAPAHAKDMKYGYLFYRCNIKTLDDSYNVYLGRPWRDYGTAAFIDCKIGNHINSKGFNKWDNTNRDKTARFFEYSENIDLSNREKWINELDKTSANKYVNEFFKFINYKE